MRSYDISLDNNKGDYILSITAFMQPILTLMQLYMIDALRLEPESTNQFRVMATALPVVFAMVIVLNRKPILAATVYGIALLVLLLTVFAFPDRWQYMKNDVMKFTLPVVIPIGLCISSIKNLAVLTRSMLYVALLAAILSIFYMYSYLSGGFMMESYSMAFSYSLLFPAFILLSKENLFWKLVGIILMLEMLAIGSRGAFLVSTAYFLYTIFGKKVSFSRITIYGSFLLMFILVFWNIIISALVDLFNLLGIRSRTLSLLMDNEIITHDSGRDDIASSAWELIDKAPILGNGVWADRQYIGGYCHNIFLELLVDFGYVGFFLIIFLFLFYQIKIFRKIPTNHKTMYVMMFSLVVPLLVSSSYLTSFNVGMFLGFSYLISSLYNRKLYQNFQYN